MGNWDGSGILDRLFFIGDLWLTIVTKLVKRQTTVLWAKQLVLLKTILEVESRALNVMIVGRFS